MYQGEIPIIYLHLAACKIHLKNRRAVDETYL